jgi:predicted nucleic acid-binding Zn ribbon protein
VPKDHFNRNIRNLIAEFCGLPRENGPAFRKEARPIANVVSFIIKKQGKAKRQAEQAIQNNWALIVGHRLANHCQPVKVLNTDILVIHSSNAVVRSELQMQKSGILTRLHRIPYCEKISDIRCVRASE